MNPDDRWLIRPSVLSAFGWVLVAFGVVTIVFSLIQGPAYEIPVTDFGRDLVGADLARNGQSPYQEISGLPPTDVVGGVGTGDSWIAHSPLAISMARTMLAVFDAKTAETVAKVLGVGVLIGILVWLIWGKGAIGRPWASAIAGSVALLMGVRSDIFWIQGASIVAMGMVGVLALIHSDRRHIGLVLLGVLVAWRPWLAPLALFLPRGKSALVDVTVVGGVAVTATLAALPAVGGWESLTDWITVALPENLAFYQTYEWNQSVVSPYVPPNIGTGLYLLVPLLLARFRRRLDEAVWPLVGALVVVAVSPIVWSQYWLALVPSFIWGRQHRPEALTLMFLVMMWPVAESSASFARLTSYLAIAIGSFVAFSVRSRSTESVRVG